MSTMKLYLPYGTFGNASHHGESWYRPHTEIILHWFVTGRKEPIAPYASLILNYKGLAPAVRARAEQTVDEFFAESEFHQLRDYLRDVHGKDVRTAILSAPVPAVRPDTQTRAGALRPFNPVAAVIDSQVLNAEGAPDDTIPETEPDDAEETDASGETINAIYRLSDEKDYPLPFAVGGFYAAVALYNPTTGPSSLREIRAVSKPAPGRTTELPRKVR